MHTVKLPINAGSLTNAGGSKAHVLINAGSQINARLLKQHGVVKYQPYTSYILSTHTLSADTDNSSFLAKQVDINAEN